MIAFVFSQFRTLSQAPGAGNGIAPMAMQPVTGAKASSDFFKFSTRCEKSRQRTQYHRLTLPCSF